MTSRSARRALAYALGTALSALGLASLQAAPTGQTAAPALPAAAEIIKKHVAAIGGEAAFKAIKSMHIKATAEIAAQKMTGDVDILQARPGKMVQRTTVTGLGLIEQGYDGKVGWSLDPQTGPSLLKGQELAELTEDAWFDGALHQASRFRELTTVERTEFDKRPAYKVKAVFLSGLEQFEYFDAETGLEIGWEGRRATSQGTIPTTAIFRDYKKFGAISMATTVIQRLLGFEQVLRQTSCEFNVVPANAFDLPPQIKALIK